MNFESLLAQGRLRSHRTNKDKIQEMLHLADRDLGDAEVKGLSLDRRFLIAYEAGLNLATIPPISSPHDDHFPACTSILSIWIKSFTAVNSGSPVRSTPTCVWAAITANASAYATG